MIGAIVGDIIGSRFERHNIKTKEFDLFSSHCRFTDDSVMSLAVAKALLECGGEYDKLGERVIAVMQEVGRRYPNAGYGGMFSKWLKSRNPQPYNSYGNGAAMRVSACGFAAKTLDEAIMLSRMVTNVTHNHPEGIKGAEATAVCIFLAREGKSIQEIRDYVDQHYYSMGFTLDAIRGFYRFDVSCQGSVPQAIMAFLESTSFEDAIRNAISLGGDSDTIAAITGGIAEAYYGVPNDFSYTAIQFLDAYLLRILADYEHNYLFEAGEEAVRLSAYPIAHENGQTPLSIILFDLSTLAYTGGINYANVEIERGDVINPEDGCNLSPDKWLFLKNIPNPDSKG